MSSTAQCTQTFPLTEYDIINNQESVRENHTVQPNFEVTTNSPYLKVIVTFTLLKIEVYCITKSSGQGQHRAKRIL